MADKLEERLGGCVGCGFALFVFGLGIVASFDLWFAGNGFPWSILGLSLLIGTVWGGLFIQMTKSREK